MMVLMSRGTTSQQGLPSSPNYAEQGNACAGNRTRRRTAADVCKASRSASLRSCLSGSRPCIRKRSRFNRSSNIVPMFHREWQTRLKQIIGPIGYQSYMRRSLQTIVLHEAKRCIEPRISRLRPFQKRALLMSMVFHIMREIDFLKASEKEAVLWKTQRRQEQIDPVTAWKRCKIIERDLGKLLQQLQPYSRPNRTHQQSINVLVQDLFNTLHGIPPTKPDGTQQSLSVPPPQWEYLHNHAILALRLYYQGQTFEFPEPTISPFEFPIPSERPSPNDPPEYQTFEDVPVDPTSTAVAALLAQQTTVAVPTAAAAATATAASSSAASAAASQSSYNSDDNNGVGDQPPTSLLQVQEQVDLLDRFRGIMPEQELERRKRALYDSLPAALRGKEEVEGDNEEKERPRKKAARS